MKNIPSTGDVLFFLCLNDRGGAEISMIRIAQGLAARGCNVTLAVYGTHPGLARELGFKGDVVNLATTRTLGAIVPLCRILRARHFPVLISALTHTNIAALAAVFLSGRSSRVLATEHGVDGIAACEKSRLFTFLTRHAYAAATVVAVSQGLAQRWRELLLLRARVTAIYNPVIPDVIAEAPPPAHPCLMQKTIPIMIGIGRLKTEKNFALLIRAFARLAAGRDARLIILGEGELRVVLENLAQELGLRDKVIMPGFVADPAAWLAYADLFVSASRREGFGNAIVEALAYGVPVVATDCPYGPAEILEAGRYGRLVPMEDEEALAHAMEDALDEPVSRQKLRARAMEFTVSRCIDLYKELLDNPPLS